MQPQRRPPLTPCMTLCQVAVSLRGPGRSPVLPFACCVGSMRSDGCCGRCSLWCRFRASGPSSWRTGGCAGCCGGRVTVVAAHSPPRSGRPSHVSPRFRVCETPLLHPASPPQPQDLACSQDWGTSSLRCAVCRSTPAPQARRPCCRTRATWGPRHL